MNAESKTAYFEKIRNNIAEYGYHVTHVSARNEDEYEPSFCYSTGISKTYGIPEIFISSLPSGLCTDLINSYIDSFHSEEVVPNQKIKLLEDWFDVYLCSVDNSKLTEYALSTFKLFAETNFSYLQLVFPDTKGLYPNDKGYEYDQVLLTEYFA